MDANVIILDVSFKLIRTHNMSSVSVNRQIYSVQEHYLNMALFLFYFVDHNQ